MNEQNFVALCNRLAAIDLFGSRPPAPPWGTDTPGVAQVRDDIEAGRPAVPLVYGDSFIDPLERQLPRVIAFSRPDTATLETLTGAVYQHDGGYALAASLDRFLAVISDLYRSFLDRQKRANVRVPLRETLPPLATFKYAGDYGPFTFPVDAVQQLIGAVVGVVSLPGAYADDPILWASLAHETGGHDVVHADGGLLKELQDGLGAALDYTPVPGLAPSELVTVWAYWMDEAVADVYGLLNIGPMFAPNLAAFFAALRSKPIAGGFPIPKVSMSSVSRPNDPLDVHPTDILRIHLALGVVENLNGLTAATRHGYVDDLEQLAALCTTGATVALSGSVVLDSHNPVRIHATVPLAAMQESARVVGRYISSAQLTTLGTHLIQDIETWDDSDEAQAEAVRRALAAGQPVAALGDDAQLLAGATARLLDAPGDYASVTAALTEGLDQSFASDPIWSNPAAEPIFMPQQPPAHM